MVIFIAFSLFYIFYKVIVHEELNIKSEDTIRMLDFRYATITFNIIYLIVKHFPLIKSDIFFHSIYLIPKKFEGVYHVQHICKTTHKIMYVVTWPTKLAIQRA